MIQIKALSFQLGSKEDDRSAENTVGKHATTCQTTSIKRLVTPIFREKNVGKQV